MDKNSSIKFYGVNEEFGCFSNFSKHTVYFDGMFWKTSEHAFQAQKFLNFEHRLAVAAAETPMKAAKIGRDRSRQLRQDWEEIKDGLMYDIVFAKVMQHAEVREKLLGTGQAEIIEHTKNDNYWADGGDGSGQNMLGKILMVIRAELTKSGPFDEMKNLMLPLWEKYPDINRYSIGWRMGYGEDYALEWGLWYCGLSASGKNRYRERFPEPFNWVGFYKDQEEEF